MARVDELALEVGWNVVTPRFLAPLLGTTGQLLLRADHGEFAQVPGGLIGCTPGIKRSLPLCVFHRLHLVPREPVLLLLVAEVEAADQSIN